MDALYYQPEPGKDSGRDDAGSTFSGPHYSSRVLAGPLLVQQQEQQEHVQQRVFVGPDGQ